MIIEKKLNGRIVVFDDNYDEIIYKSLNELTIDQEIQSLSDISPLSADEFEERMRCINRIKELDIKESNYEAFVSQGLQKKLDTLLSIKNELTRLKG